MRFLCFLHVVSYVRTETKQRLAIVFRHYLHSYFDRLFGYEFTNPERYVGSSNKGGVTGVGQTLFFSVFGWETCGLEGCTIRIVN